MEWKRLKVWFFSRPTLPGIVLYKILNKISRPLCKWLCDIIIIRLLYIQKKSMEATELATFETKLPDPDDLIQSSMESSRQTRSVLGIKRKGRFGFFPILSLIGSINQNTQYVTFTTTSTFYLYSATKTFFMQNCIPQPFGYPICSVRKR